MGCCIKSLSPHVKGEEKYASQKNTNTFTNTFVAFETKVDKVQSTIQFGQNETVNSDNSKAKNKRSSDAR